MLTLKRVPLSELSAMMFALGGIIAYGTEHDHDDKNSVKWIALLAKLRAHYTECFDNENAVLKLKESERSQLEGAMSYATGFYSMFRYVEHSIVMSACNTIKMDSFYKQSALQYFADLRGDLVTLRGEEYVVSLDSKY